MPATNFPSVLLPAPFSPQSAWHDPRAMSKLTSSSACTPGKRLPTFRKEMIGASSKPLLQLEVFLGDVGEAPLAQLPRPGPEVVLGDPHRIHGDDLRNVLLEDDLV